MSGHSVEALRNAGLKRLKKTYDSLTEDIIHTSLAKTVGGHTVLGKISDNSTSLRKTILQA